MDNRAQINIQQRDAVEAEIAKRTKAHKRRVNQVKSVGKHQPRALNQTANQATASPLDFLAIGDSWFDYPLNGNDVSFSTTDIIAQLPSLGNPQPTILNYALLGQATTAVLSYENQQRMIDVLSDSSQWINGSADAILISAGGDDLVGDQFAVYLDYGGGGLNVARFQGALDSVRASYMDLFAFRDIFAPGKPIIGHCYDYAVPNGIAPLCAGPWLQPSLDFAKYDYNGGLAIVVTMINMFYGMLNALAGAQSNNFVLVDTRNTLVRDASSPNGWANEIHPYPAGFTALANKFLVALRGHFPPGSI
jgi:hypothetical protein